MNPRPTSTNSSRSSLRRITTHIICILLATTGAALADNSIKLQVAPKSEHNDPKGNNPQEVQNRWLEISATAFHLEKPAAVRLEWAFFGDNLDTDKVVKHGSGTETVELAQSKQAVAKTKPVNFTFTPRHSVRTGSGKRARSKVIEATGVRYHAWGVRAFVDGKLAGEAYSSPSIQKLMGGTD
ncbi:MAG: hypothetical protein IAE77_00705 [Prosthecobacter sp.]|uniref:hypothetical protein n=1 Tax=Prosthecobacter sp. TaxID=1965333 RepID=UPI0019FD882A|nr:hypothetical protein [Prosthecobacter sp.]MBE2281958.1 hypothetical protein [Prosthecobacter sp.]